MEDEAKFCYELTEEMMEKAKNHLEQELNKIRAGKANANLLDPIKLDYYGEMVPLSQVATLAVPDAKTIMVKPWEQNMLGPIEKAIQLGNLGFNPVNNGEVIHVTIPPLTEERRLEYVRKVKSEGENSKVSIRNARREANDTIKGLIKKGMAEDVGKDYETKIQILTDSYITKIDNGLAAKEKDIMTV